MLTYFILIIVILVLIVVVVKQKRKIHDIKEINFRLGQKLDNH